MHYFALYLILLFKKTILLPVSACKIAEWVTNCVDHDQTPFSAASDKGLHCLLRSVYLHTYSKYGNFYQIDPLRNHHGSAPAFSVYLKRRALRKHAYSNILKILPPKNGNFQIKNSDIFHISTQKIDCGYSLEPPLRGGSNEYPQSMFWAEIRKIMYTPVNPSFTI